MMNQEIYDAEQDYNRYQMLINTKEILTQEEYEFCKEWDAEETWKYLNDIGERGWLNINVYSEYKHEEHQLRMEMGI